MARSRWLKRAIRTVWECAAWTMLGLILAYGLLSAILAPLGQ